MKFIWIILTVLIILLFTLYLKKNELFHNKNNYLKTNNINGYYINLNHRIDRNKHIEKLKNNNTFFKNIIRFPAIQHNNGGIGCGLSHIAVLEKCLNKDNEYFLILEDDFTILNDENFKKFINSFNTIKNDKEWDIITLTPFYSKPYESYYNKNMYTNGFKRIFNVQTLSGIIVRKKIIPILINNFKKAINELANGKSYKIFAIDQYWKSLQKEFKFYCYNKQVGGQLPSYSDIEKKWENYNKLL